MQRPGRSAYARHWLLDPSVIFLNHGGFGACPIPVLEAQTRLRERIEREPTRFFTRELEPLLDAARTDVAAFLGARPDDLAFIPNSTLGVNTVLHSLRLGPEDELLTTSHVYNACLNALTRVTERSGTRVKVVTVPFPFSSEEELVAPVLNGVTPRTRLVLLDHVTSPTGVVFPINRLCAQLQSRGVDVLIDGAHAPGMVPLDLTQIGAAYYVGNFHKWVCSPKGAAFLHVRPDRQERLTPLVTSHGATAPLRGRSRFRLEFDWTGTDDPTAYLCVPEALRFMGSLLEGGWPALRHHNRQLAIEGRRALCEALSVQIPCPDSCIGSLASVPLPDLSPREEPPALGAEDPLQELLWDSHRIQLRVAPWPTPTHRVLRVSAQIYGTLAEMKYVSEVLRSTRA